MSLVKRLVTLGFSIAVIFGSYKMGSMYSPPKYSDKYTETKIDSLEYSSKGLVREADSLKVVNMQLSERVESLESWNRSLEGRLSFHRINAVSMYSLVDSLQEENIILRFTQKLMEEGIFYKKNDSFIYKKNDSFKALEN